MSSGLPLLPVCPHVWPTRPVLAVNCRQQSSQVKGLVSEDSAAGMDWLVELFRRLRTASKCRIPVMQAFRHLDLLIYKTRSIWKMLGPFATASRRTPPVLHCNSPGVATVARRLRIGVHNNDDNDNNDNNDNAWQRGPLWPHRMGPKMAFSNV